MSNKVIMGNMVDLVVRELWGAYEHEHKQRVMQLIRVVGCYSEPLLFVEASQTQPWVILHLNEAAVTVTGTSLPLTFAGVTARDASPKKGYAGRHGLAVRQCVWRWCAGLRRTNAINQKFWDVFCGIEESNAVVSPHPSLPCHHNSPWGHEVHWTRACSAVQNVNSY